MTVYELVQELVQYDADAEVRFNVKGQMDFNTFAEFDREDENDQQEVTVTVDIDDNFEFDCIRDWTNANHKMIEINLEY